jgi:hypothetical protein
LIISGDTIQPSIGTNITVPSGLGINVGSTKIGEIGADYGAFKGNVVQCRVTRYDTQVSLTTGTGVSGIEITGMQVSITPKFINSMIICQFQIHGEGSSGEHNLMFNVYRNGSIPTGTYSAFNTVAGNNIWSGVSMATIYDSAQNSDSTPTTQTFFYHDFPNTNSNLIYSPGVKSTDGTSRTFVVNRSIGSLGGSASEVGISYSMVWEIAQ